MLDRLNDIPWPSLTHAYGPASDVPDLIQQVAQGSDKDRQAAWYELYGNILHQGTVYEATSFAVPFFIELARDSSRTDYDEVLSYLAALAQGTSYRQVHEDVVGSLEGQSRDEHQTQLARELGWVEKTKLAVRDGIEVYRALLAHSSPAARAAAANLISCLPSEDARVQAWLVERLESETDETVRAALILALSVLSARAGVLHAKVRDAFAASEPFSIRTLAALGHVWTERSGTPKDVQAFIRHLSEEQLEGVLHNFPWDAGNAIDYLENVQQMLAADHA